MPTVSAALAAAAGLFSAGSLVCAVEHMFASRRVMQEAERAGWQECFIWLRHKRNRAWTSVSYGLGNWAVASLVMLTPEDIWFAWSVYVLQILLVGSVWFWEWKSKVRKQQR